VPKPSQKTLVNSTYLEEKKVIMNMCIFTYFQLHHRGSCRRNTARMGVGGGVCHVCVERHRSSL